MLRMFPQRKRIITDQLPANFIFQTPAQRVTLSQVLVAGVTRHGCNVTAQVRDLVLRWILFQRAQAFEQTELDIIINLIELAVRAVESKFVPEATTDDWFDLLSVKTRQCSRLIG